MNTPMLFRADSVSKSYCTNPLDYVSVSGNILIVDWLNLFHKFAEIFQFCNGSASLLKGLVIFFFIFIPKFSLINGSFQSSLTNDFLILKRQGLQNLLVHNNHFWDSCVSVQHQIGGK